MGGELYLSGTFLASCLLPLVNRRSDKFAQRQKKTFLTSNISPLTSNSGAHDVCFLWGAARRLLAYATAACRRGGCSQTLHLARNKQKILLYKIFSHCTAFHNGTRKESVKLQQGEALLHGRSVPVWEQRSFTTATPICGAPAVWGFRRAAVAFASDRRRRGFHPRPDDPFEKGSIENFYILDKI